MPEIEKGQYGFVVYVDATGKPDFALRHLVENCPWHVSWPGEGDLAEINIAAASHTLDCQATKKPACHRCKRPFHDSNACPVGATQYGDSGFCISCTENCAFTEDPFHRCEICEPEAYPLTGGKK